MPETPNAKKVKKKRGKWPTGEGIGAELPHLDKMERQRVLENSGSNHIKISTYEYVQLLHGSYQPLFLVLKGNSQRRSWNESLTAKNY